VAVAELRLKAQVDTMRKVDLSGGCNLASKRIRGVIARSIRDFHAEINTTAATVNAHEDSVVVWIVGMGAGALALLARHATTSTSVGCEIRTAAVLMAVAIAFGLSSRVLTRGMNLAQARRWRYLVGNMTSLELESKLDEVAPGIGEKAGDELGRILDFLRGQGDAKERDNREQTYITESERYAKFSNLTFMLCLLCFVTAGWFVVGAFFF
jgi:hypothetical protein